MSTEVVDALIVRNLLDVERAFDRVNNNIGPKICKEIDNIIESWASENDCYSKLDFNEGLSEFAPNTWRIADPEASGDKFFAKFSTDTNDVGRNDPPWIWVIQLCNLGSGPYGFRWECDFVEMGSTKGEWRRFVGKTNATAALKGFGFEYQDKSGAFFLPFIIDKEALAKAIEENNIEDALAPVRVALNIILKSWGVFDEIINQFKKK